MANDRQNGVMDTLTNNSSAAEILAAMTEKLERDRNDPTAGLVTKSMSDLSIKDIKDRYIAISEKSILTGQPIEGDDCAFFIEAGNKYLSKEFQSDVYDLAVAKLAQINTPEPALTQEDEQKMNAPVELKALEMPIEKELPLMEQISKAMPAILAGQNFKTEIKAAPIAGTNTAATGAVKIGLPPEFAGFVPTALAAPNRLYSLLPKRSASGQSVTFIQLGLTTNGAAVTKELATKSESTVSATTKNIEILTIAHWIAASKQVLSDSAGLEAAIGSTLSEGLLRAVDAHIYSALSTNATEFVPTLTGADVLAEAVLKIQTAGGQNPIVLLNPADYLAMMTTKATGSGLYLGVSPMPTNAVACSSIEAGKVLAFDRSATTLFERESASLFVGYQGSQFIENAVTILSELRIAAAVLNPNLVCFGDLVVPVVPETKAK
jgi:HK97 family phage major capsid protein